MLGFIFRSTRDFPDTLSFKILYCSLVRSVLEFSSCIWNPSYAFHSGRIERIQHRALRMLDGKSRSSVLSSSSSSSLSSSSTRFMSSIFSSSLRHTFSTFTPAIIFSLQAHGM
uniref:Uncharacterized protein n=1 Tax=Cacopsylla melanoneura TaxID=428564 RepID=A0A8D8ZPX0_9HEMI